MIALHVLLLARKRTGIERRPARQRQRRPCAANRPRAPGLPTGQAMAGLGPAAEFPGAMRQREAGGPRQSDRSWVLSFLTAARSETSPRHEMSARHEVSAREDRKWIMHRVRYS